MTLPEVFMALKVYRTFSQINCTHFFQKLIDQGFALVYIDLVYPPSCSYKNSYVRLN